MHWLLMVLHSIWNTISWMLSCLNADVTSSINICAAHTKPTKNQFQGRKGAKAVKRLERLESKYYALSPDEATMYRAINARANYLAQDRPDIALSTKQ